MFLFNKRITIIGDINQSIYSFRGGTWKVFQMFEELCSKNNISLKKVNLKYNYRSTKNIIEGFEKLISKNQSSKDISKSFTKNLDGDKINIIYYNTIQDQIDYIIKDIKKSTVPYNEICILSRKKKSLSEFEKELKKNNIECSHNKIKSIVDQLISYFTIIIECKNDQKEFWEIINVPKRSLALPFKNYFEEFKSEYKLNDKSNFEICEMIINKDFPSLKRKIKIYKKSQEGLSSFVKLIDKLRKDLKKYTLEEFIDFTFQSLELEKYVDKEQEKIKKYNNEDDSNDDEPEDSIHKLNNLKKIAHSFITENNFKKDQKINLIILEEFVNYSKIYQTKEEIIREEGEKVIIGTIHSQKGLEYKTVYIVNVEDSICPIYPDKEWSIETKKEFLAEERRILFVGMSRAKQYLHIFTKKGTFSKDLEEIEKKNVIYLNPPPSKTNETKIQYTTNSSVQNFQKINHKQTKVLPNRSITNIRPTFKINPIQDHPKSQEIKTQEMIKSQVKIEMEDKDVEYLSQEEKSENVDQYFSQQNFEYIEREVKVEKTKSVEIKKEKQKIKPVRKIEDIIYEISDEENEPKKLKKDF